MELTVVAVISTVLLAAITIIYGIITGKFGPRIYKYFEKKGIKGPDPQFPFGTWKGAWKKNIGEDDLENVKKYGKVFGTYDGLTPNLIVADPVLIQKLLENDCDKFQSHRAFRVKQKVLHQSLRYIEGGQSKQVKEVLNLAFGDNKIKKLFPRLSKTAETFVQHLSKAVEQENTLNISEQISGFINDTLAFCLFGLDLNVDNAVREKFHKAINQVFKVDNPDSTLTVTPFIYESLGSLDNFVLKPPAAKYLTGLIELVLEEKKKTLDVKPEGRAVDFVDLLLAAIEEEKQNAAKEKGTQEESVDTLLKNEELVNVCMEVILTVGRAAKSSLALTFQTLAQYPDIQQKLYRGITEQLSHHNEINYKFIQGFEYLDMVLGEILRLYPVEYRLERKCIEEVVWDNLKICPGEIVSVPIYSVHRLSEYYADPEKFLPERFNEENSKKRNHYTYLPFGQAGANSTNVGVQLGVLFNKMAIVTLVKEMKFTKVEDNNDESIEFVKGITGVPTPKPVWIKIEKRE